MSPHRAAASPPVCPLRRCIYITITCASTTMLRHLSTHGLRPADWVFVIELPLPTPSLSHARRSHHSCRWYWQHQCVLLSPTRCWVANPACASALRRLDCIDFGIDPPVPTPSASIASTSASPPPNTAASTHLRHHLGAPCAPAAPLTR